MVNLIIGLIAIALLITGCSRDASQASNLDRAGPAAPGVVRVEIVNFTFNPGTINITLGTKVIWTNQDRARHSATDRKETWDSSLLANGENYEKAFDQKGAHEYYCTLHPFMTAKVVVVAEELKETP